MTIQTDNFHPSYDKKLLCTCGNLLCDKRSVNQSTLNKAQLVRVDANRPLTVTSGGRCTHHKDESHRTTPADHQKGIGIDIKVNGGLERAEIVTLGIKHGFNAIGVGKGFIHLGDRKGHKLVMWVY